MKGAKRVASILMLASAAFAQTVDYCKGITCDDGQMCNPATGACPGPVPPVPAPEPVIACGKEKVDCTKNVDSKKTVCDEAAGKCVKDKKCAGISVDANSMYPCGKLNCCEADLYCVKDKTAYPDAMEPPNSAEPAKCKVLADCDCPGTAEDGQKCRIFGDDAKDRCEEGLFCIQSILQKMKQKDDEPYYGYCMNKNGPPGCDGRDVIGESGRRGQKGYPGKPGRPGDKGAVGDDGEQGIQGIAGPKGEEGNQGPKGKDGDDGCPGEDGEPGKNGDKGDKGDDGIDGRDGCNGEDGQQGAPGKSGKCGQDGRNGEDGQDGTCDASGCNDCKNSVEEAKRLLSKMKRVIRNFEDNED